MPNDVVLLSRVFALGKPCDVLKCVTGVCNPAGEVSLASDDLVADLSALRGVLTPRRLTGRQVEDRSHSMANAACGLIDELDLSTSFGLAAQAGADWRITDKTFLNLDLMNIEISTDAESGGIKLRTAEINPLVSGLGIDRHPYSSHAVASQLSWVVASLETARSLMWRLTSRAVLNCSSTAAFPPPTRVRIVHFKLRSQCRQRIAGWRTKGKPP